MLSLSESYKRYSKKRNEKGVTNYRVAKATGVTQKTLSLWKNGKLECFPKVETLAKIAEYLETTLSYLLEGKEDDTCI